MRGEAAGAIGGTERRKRMATLRSMRTVPWPWARAYGAEKTPVRDETAQRRMLRICDATRRELVARLDRGR